MKIFCYYQEVYADNSDDLLDDGICFFDTEAKKLIDYWNFVDYDDNLSASINKYMLLGEEEITIKNYSSREEENPNYDHDYDSDDENPRYIERTTDMIVRPLYQNTIPLMPLPDGIFYAMSYRARVSNQKIKHKNLEVFIKSVKVMSDRHLAVTEQELGRYRSSPAVDPVTSGIQMRPTVNQGDLTADTLAHYTAPFTAEALTALQNQLDQATIMQIMTPVPTVSEGEGND